MYSRYAVFMKTTIDIPEPLYRQAKIRAIETGRTLKHLVLDSLTRELDLSPSDAGENRLFHDRRKLRPDFVKAVKAGAFRPVPGDRDVSDLISEDRNER